MLKPHFLQTRKTSFKIILWWLKNWFGSSPFGQEKYINPRLRIDKVMVTLRISGHYEGWAIFQSPSSRDVISAHARGYVLHTTVTTISGRKTKA